jgi:hypothetical protein
VKPSLRANGSRECAPDDRLREAIQKPPSFRGDAKHRTRNLEIPGLVLTHHPGMTASDLLRGFAPSELDSRSYTATRRPGSDAGNSRSSICFETMTKTQAKQLVVCVENDGYAVSLEKRKIYVALRAAAAEKHNLLRIVDESGEDYLYPKALFRSIALPQAVRRAVLAA